MTNEQQHAIIGKVVLDKREAEKRLTLLKEEAKRLGNCLGSLAGYLRGNVEYVWFEGISTNSNYPHPRGETFNVVDFDGKRIADLTSQIRTTKDEIRKLDAQARDLGL